MMTIIAATDFSILADNAVEYAAAIAKHKNAKLILFNSFVIPFHAANTLLPASSIQALMIENEIRLLERSFSLSYDYEIEVGHESAFSFIEDELKEVIQKYKAELVVLGMPKKTLEQDLWGNTTSFAIKNLKIPVLAVPQNARFEGAKKVLFACDVLRGLSKKALASIKEVALDLEAQVEVFNVDQTLEVLRSEQEHSTVVNALDDGLDGITYYYKNVKSFMVIREIEKEIIEFQADLLIMVPKKYGFWANIIHRSKTRVMASGLNIPLLSIPL
ncbi:nucleotide-binding universal stress UspA family protein [Pedobacter cryoconitis]|uniref:universal stress protein n=1 Tax=Pedobacter cryoconitis TaxID=188932 RepID=UPI00178ECD05|nr:universal stress protein [Pedobacter cryoconitis]MBB6274560.1 nucleotide-binding universal stress UspA family protein [Pedobacter cryoconitis]